MQMDHRKHYELRIEGHFASRWRSVFCPFSAKAEDGGTTVLRGAVPDQAALFGLLRTLEGAGIVLLDLRQLRDRGA
ncbi:MAG: hypothetical protein B7733_15795 [Myxococcales bacterium FL481]|nr:MAG: hypothetical protein B7733_15795 [Myxococcales bacterium FL481]